MRACSTSSRGLGLYEPHDLFGAFISGLPPEQIYAQSVRTNRGFGLIDRALRYEADPAKRQVTTTIAGGFGSRAVFRDDLGCLVVHEATLEVARPLPAYLFSIPYKHPAARLSGDPQRLVRGGGALSG